MKTLQEIRDRIKAILAEQRSMVDKAKEEKRDLTEEEDTNFQALLEERQKLVKDEARLAELEEREKEQESVETITKRFIPGVPNQDKQISEGEKRDINGYSFQRALRSVIVGDSPDGVEAEMHQEAQKEYRNAGLESEGGFMIPQIVLAHAGEKRDMTATGGSGGDQGGQLIQTNIAPLIERLKAKLLVAQMGAQQLSGLQGNINFPKFVAADAAVEKAENAAADESSPTLATISLAPNRLPVLAEFSRQLVIQAENESVENMLRNDLAYQIAAKMDSSAINGSGSAPVPEGILNTTGIGAVVGGTNGLAPTWDHIVDLETQIAIDNADEGALGYLTNPNVRGKLKRTFVDSGSNAERVWSNITPDAPLNGYRAGVTTQVPNNLTKGTSSGICSAIIFGNWADLMIGQWGGIEFILDQYTKAGTGLVTLHAWTFYDVLVKRAQSFAAMEDALTA